MDDPVIPARICGEVRAKPTELAPTSEVESNAPRELASTLPQPQPVATRPLETPHPFPSPATPVLDFAERYIAEHELELPPPPEDVMRPRHPAKRTGSKTIAKAALELPAPEPLTGAVPAAPEPMELVGDPLALVGEPLVPQTASSDPRERKSARFYSTLPEPSARPSQREGEVGLTSFLAEQESPVAVLAPPTPPQVAVPPESEGAVARAAWDAVFGRLADFTPGESGPSERTQRKPHSTNTTILGRLKSQEDTPPAATKDREPRGVFHWKSARRAKQRD